MTNTWPSGYRHALNVRQHRDWNEAHYPGTRQLCITCDQPTGRCEEDSIHVGNSGPLCEECRDAWPPCDKHHHNGSEHAFSLGCDNKCTLPHGHEGRHETAIAEGGSK